MSDVAGSVGVHQDLGYEPDAGARQEAIDRAAAVLGARVSRSSLLWDQIEPSPGQRDWSRYDDIVDSLQRRGIIALLVFVGSPPWARGGAKGTVDASDDRFTVPVEPEAFSSWVRAYATFAGAAAARYRGRVLWETWNEPNNRNFWKPAPDAQRYARLFGSIRASVLHADAAAQVSVGGLDNLSTAFPPDIDGRSFLGQLAEAGANLDLVAVHPYPSDQRPPLSRVAGANNVDDVGDVIDELRALGAPRAHVWVTELGWDHDQVGLEAQARNIVDGLTLIRERYPQVTVVIVFVDQDRAVHAWGLIDAEGRTYPAGSAFARYLSTLPRQSPTCFRRP